ncbi:hypothetical protein DPEC_G00073300 [Dallia pectoralis]|uniref:Uncharacterized protein n=1 Tax=Dallia pectoralis TaxID=75939 RepID=A0ACC2H2J4_DALPE|nr:hypothetical protein DPEC_G00073300 [Dallia pectoralis]
MATPKTIGWDAETTVRQAKVAQPYPGGSPAGHLFVPDQACTAVLEWCHSSNLACHPGAHRTLVFIRQRLWWPPMLKNVPEFLAACAVRQGQDAAKSTLWHFTTSPVPHSRAVVDHFSKAPVCKGNPHATPRLPQPAHWSLTF